MKANQKFRASEDAVSPVIAVILMVAITVVLAATVYVWVSGFGGGQGTPAKSIALTSAGAIGHADDDDLDPVADFSQKNYTVSSAVPGTTWSDLTFTLSGAALDYAATPLTDQTGQRDYRNDTTASDGPTFCVVTGGGACAASASAAGVIGAGHMLRITTTYASATLPTLGSSPTLRVLDTQANSVIFTLTVG